MLAITTRLGETTLSFGRYKGNAIVILQSSFSLWLLCDILLVVDVERKEEMDEVEKEEEEGG